jgi:hypothetical protein
MATVRIRRALVLVAVLAAPLAGCNDDGGSPGDGGTQPIVDPTITVAAGAWQITVGSSGSGQACVPYSAFLCEKFYGEPYAEIDLDQQAQIFGFDCDFTVRADGTIQGSCAAGSRTVLTCVVSYPAFQATGSVSADGRSFAVVLPLNAQMSSGCPLGPGPCSYQVMVSGARIGDDCPPDAPQPGSWRTLNARY